jgi:hypothetical protein
MFGKGSSEVRMVLVSTFEFMVLVSTFEFMVLVSTLAVTVLVSALVGKLPTGFAHAPPLDVPPEGLVSGPH